MSSDQDVSCSEDQITELKNENLVLKSQVVMLLGIIERQFGVSTPNKLPAELAPLETRWIQLSSATPIDFTRASRGVRKPRHFRGVVLYVHMMSLMS